MSINDRPRGGQCGRVYLLRDLSKPLAPCILPSGHQAPAGHAENLCRDAQGCSWVYGAGEDPQNPRRPAGRTLFSGTYHEILYKTSG